jgi:hypothetical protein
VPKLAHRNANIQENTDESACGASQSNFLPMGKLKNICYLAGKTHQLHQIFLFQN